jgi:hypothetical protein
MEVLHYDNHGPTDQRLRESVPDAITVSLSAMENFAEPWLSQARSRAAAGR